MKALVIVAMLASGCWSCIGEPFTLLEDESAPAQTVLIEVGAPVYPEPSVEVDPPAKVPRTRPVDGGAP